MSSLPTNAVALQTPPSQIDLALGSLTTFTTTIPVVQPTTTYSNILGAAGRITTFCPGRNYAKIIPIANTASVTFTVSVIGWNRGNTISTTPPNNYNWVCTPLVTLSLTTGSATVGGTPFGTVYGAASFALVNGDCKIYNASPNAPTGFILVDLLGSEAISVVGHTVSGSVTYSHWIGFI